MLWIKDEKTNVMENEENNGAIATATNAFDNNPT